MRAPAHVRSPQAGAEDDWPSDATAVLLSELARHEARPCGGGPQAPDLGSTLGSTGGSPLRSRNGMTPRTAGMRVLDLPAPQLDNFVSHAAANTLRTTSRSVQWPGSPSQTAAKWSGRPRKAARHPQQPGSVFAMPHRTGCFSLPQHLRPQHGARAAAAAAAGAASAKENPVRTPSPSLPFMPRSPRPDLSNRSPFRRSNTSRVIAVEEEKADGKRSAAMAERRSFLAAPVVETFETFTMSKQAHHQDGPESPEARDEHLSEENPDSGASSPRQPRQPRQRQESPLDDHFAERFTGSFDPRSSQRTAIWNLRLGSTKRDRMHSLKAGRRSQTNIEGVAETYRDRISSRADIELARQSYERYFGSSKRGKGVLDMTKLFGAMRDFGLRAAPGGQKAQLVEVVNNSFNEGDPFAFPDFCTILEEGRAKLRNLQTFTLFQAWKLLDTDDFGVLSPEYIMKMLDNLDLTPENGRERTLTEKLVSELNRDEDTGLIPFSEVEYLVQQLREWKEGHRRRRERDIKEKYHLDFEMFSEFRSQLVELHKAFVEADEDESEALDKPEVFALLSDFGCISSSPAQHEHRMKVGTIIDTVFLENFNLDISFAGFLNIIIQLRELDMQEREEDVMVLLRKYDLDTSGELDMGETCKILEDMGMSPKSIIEQEAIAELLDEVDKDGSGSIDFDELQIMVQRIIEMFVKVQRQMENKRAQELNFPRPMVKAMRVCFETLDVRATGSLTSAQVQRAVQLMRWRLSNNQFQKVMREVDEDESGQLDFCEFLTFMQRAEEAVDKQWNLEGERRPMAQGGAQEPHSPVKRKETAAEEAIAEMLSPKAGQRGSRSAKATPKGEAKPRGSMRGSRNMSVKFADEEKGREAQGGAEAASSRTPAASSGRFVRALGEGLGDKGALPAAASN